MGNTHHMHASEIQTFFLSISVHREIKITGNSTNPKSKAKGKPKFYLGSTNGCRMKQGCFCVCVPFPVKPKQLNTNHEQKPTGKLSYTCLF